MAVHTDQLAWTVPESRSAEHLRIEAIGTVAMWRHDEGVAVTERCSSLGAEHLTERDPHELRRQCRHHVGIFRGEHGACRVDEAAVRSQELARRDDDLALALREARELVGAHP